MSRRAEEEFKLIKELKSNYNPLYFLASLGNGGLAVSFFMYFMFMVPHPETAMPTFHDITAYLTGGSLLIASLVILAYAGVIYFAYRHFYMLFWNVREFNLFKHTQAYTDLKASNNASAFMAIPLTFSMTINAFFVLGAIFIPNLFNVIEYLLPFALIGFLIVGYYAIKIYLSYFTQFLQGKFKIDQNNHLGQMLAVFTFAMVAVGLAAPAGISRVVATSSIATFFSLFFATVAVSLALVIIVLGVRGMLEKGVAMEAAPSLWLSVPITTLLGITFVRLYSGVSHNLFDTTPSPGVLFIVLSILVSIQIAFLGVGYFVLKQIGYFKNYTHLEGPNKSAGSFTLICPGVAFFVLGMFFVGDGLIKSGIVDQFSVWHFLVLLPFVFSQFKTIQVLARINKKNFNKETVKELDAKVKVA